MNLGCYVRRCLRIVLSLLLALAPMLCGAQGQQQNQIRISQQDQAVLGKISPSSMRGHLSFIAPDLLEGRDSPSKGLDIAAEYIAAQFRRAGLEPIGDDGYFQTANLLEVQQPVGFSLTISRQGGDIEVVPDQVSAFLDQGLEISRAKLYKLNAEDPSALASIVPDQVGVRRSSLSVLLPGVGIFRIS